MERQQACCVSMAWQQWGLQESSWARNYFCNKVMNVTIDT